MEFEPMKISPEEDRDTVDSEPKHYQRALPAPDLDV